MQLPRLRAMIRRVLISIATIATLVFLLVPFWSDIAWTGYASIRLEFLILDELTARPIEGASVRLVESSPEYAAVTSRDGRATVVIRAMTAGRSSVFFAGSQSVNYGWGLMVTADGYESINESLRGVTRGPSYHSDPTPPPIVIRLAPVTSQR